MPCIIHVSRPRANTWPNTLYFEYTTPTQLPSQLAPLAPALHHVSTCTSSATSRDQRTPCLHHDPPQVVLAVVRVGIRVPLLDLRLVARHLQLVLEAQRLTMTLSMTMNACRRRSCRPLSGPSATAPCLLGLHLAIDGPVALRRRDRDHLCQTVATLERFSTTPPAGSTPGTARFLCTCTSPASQARPV